VATGDIARSVLYERGHQLRQAGIQARLRINVGDIIIEPASLHQLPL